MKFYIPGNGQRLNLGKKLELRTKHKTQKISTKYVYYFLILIE